MFREFKNEAVLLIKNKIISDVRIYLSNIKIIVYHSMVTRNQHYNFGGKWAKVGVRLC